MHLRFIDLDGSVVRQASLALALPWESVEVVPMRDLEAPLRLWASRRAIGAARDRLNANPASPTAMQINMLGSGDFHHIAALLLERCDEATTLVHFDNHPDWVWAAPRWHCGGWINRALDLPCIFKVVTLGPCSDDLIRPELKGGNVGALARGDITLFPWQRPPSRVWRAVPDGAGHRRSAGHLVWRNLADGPMASAMREVVAAIPTRAIWISIDKDVLPPEDATTNWDQGRMPLHALLWAIDALGRERRIVGADICGEYSRPCHRHPLKRWEARMDQPQHNIVDEQALARNERTNLALLAVLQRVAA